LNGSASSGAGEIAQVKDDGLIQLVHSVIGNRQGEGLGACLSGSPVQRTAAASKIRTRGGRAASHGVIGRAGCGAAATRPRGGDGGCASILASAGSRLGKLDGTNRRGIIIQDGDGADCRRSQESAARV